MLMKNQLVNCASLLIFTCVLSMSNAQAVTTPVQIATSAAGVGTDSPNLLLVALPIQNIGTATAENIMITSIKLASSTLIDPSSFPLSLGDLPKEGIALINAQFDSSPLIPRSNYRMTVRGTYDIGGKTYGFSVNRNITVPPSSPGSSTLDSSSITSFTITDPPKLPVPATLPEGEDESRNPERPPVPVGRFQIVYPNAFSTSSTGEQPPGTGGSGAGVVSFGRNTPFGGGTGTPVDPSGASGTTGNGQDVVLTTGNTYASVSVDGGQTFTNINPFCMFGYTNCDAAGNPTGTPLVDGNLCCDQVVQYIPAINRFVWLMQSWPSGWINGVRVNAMNQPIPSGNNRLRIVVVSPDDVRSWATGGGSSWLVLDLTTATLGLTGANDWMDYPDMSVGNNFLYVSVDRLGSGTGLIVARIPLNQLSSAGTVNIGYTGPGDINGRAHGSHLTQNPGDTMFWAGHNTNKKLTIFDMPENSNRFGWRDVDINSYSNSTSDYSSTTPTGTDWLVGSRTGITVAQVPGFGLENIQGAVRVPIPQGLCPPEGCSPIADEIWFAWGAGKNTSSGRPHPYVEVVKIDSQSFAVKQSMHIWNDKFAFAYPAFARNFNFIQEVGVAIGVGGGDREAHTSVGFMQDFLVWALSNSDSSMTRYGDYVTIRRASPDERLFSAVGYGIRAGVGFDPHYVLFGRFCHVNPSDPSCQPVPPPR
jgi:hypothetical protein